MTELKPGLKGTAEMTVRYEDTANSLESKIPAVLSTPCVLNLLETACFNAILDCYHEGEVSVGIEANFKHMAASPVGQHVIAHAELIEVKGRVMTFKVDAFDERRQIADGYHKRAIINRQQFIDAL